jgi:CRP/FNR family transcriptional regulator
MPTLLHQPFLRADDRVQPVVFTERQREQLTRISTRLRLPARTLIYEEAGPACAVYAIDDGVVKSCRDLRSGKRVVNAFLFRRDLFGLSENGRYVNAAYAVTRVSLYRLPMTELATLLKQDGEIQFTFLTKVTHELRESQHRSVVISRRDAAGRLAMFVVLMSHRDLARGADARLIPLPMTRSDIAGFVGLSLESVSRAARELERLGVLRFEGRHGARVLSDAKLSRLVAAV